MSNERSHNRGTLSAIGKGAAIIGIMDSRNEHPVIGKRNFEQGEKSRRCTEAATGRIILDGICAACEVEVETYPKPEGKAMRPGDFFRVRSRTDCGLSLHIRRECKQ